MPANQSKSKAKATINKDAAIAIENYGEGRLLGQKVQQQLRQVFREFFYSYFCALTAIPKKINCKANRLFF
jgi:hypothetical protein